MFPELIDTEQRDQALMAFLVELATVTGKPGGCSAWRKTSRNRCYPTTLTRRLRPTVAIHGRTSAPITTGSCQLGRQTTSATDHESARPHGENSCKGLHT